MADKNFVELNRTFRQLTEKELATDSERFLPSGHENTNWKQLLQEFRVIILSEAGSGKTAEIRHRAREMSREGMPSFFIRLEHVVDGFDGAFEEGTHEDFEDWLHGSGEGWLFLDSVDESKLRSQADFERAVRKVGQQLKKVFDRIHIVITGRISAWQPKVDLALCERQLPCAVRRIEPNAAEGVFKIYALNDLTPDQVEVYANHKGVRNVKQFRDDIERADAWSFTARPQDLEELTGFWLAQGRIGSRLELMRASIERRLREWDPIRDDARPLSMDRAWEGAMRIAAACTLAHEQIIRVPDGAVAGKGLAVREILPDWDARECAALLARPIFDEAIYGAVRFHHRSVREYLTAEWFAKLLSSKVSRRRIEELFFRRQYGLEVVVPTLRPVLPWLCILDARIAERVSRVAPEVLFEGGDPGQLPLDVRRHILQKVCGQIGDRAVGRNTSDDAAVQRFAKDDLAVDVIRLMEQYKSNEEALIFLLRMVWLGKLVVVLPVVNELATGTTASEYVRMMAIKSFMALGSVEQKALLRTLFLNEVESLDRLCVSAFIDEAESSFEYVTWIFEVFRKMDDGSPRSIDRVAWSFIAFVRRADLCVLPAIIENANDLLGQLPYVKPDHCEVSAKYYWLSEAAGWAIERLLKARDPALVKPVGLGVLHKVSISERVSVSRMSLREITLSDLVAEWVEVKYALFWYLVHLDRNRNDRQESKFQVTHWNTESVSDFSMQFSERDFGFALSGVVGRPLLDDRLVALSLAVHIYVEGGRNPVQLDMLKQAVRRDNMMSSILSTRIRPPVLSVSAKRWGRRRALNRRMRRREQVEEQIRHNEWREYLNCNAQLLRICDGAEEGCLLDDHVELWRIIRRNGHEFGIVGNWRSLVPEFGEVVALAFRDGAVN